MMIDHVPVYEMPDGSIVQAGRIHKFQGPRVVISTAPVDRKASQSNGYPLKPIPIDDAVRPHLKPGLVLVLKPYPICEVVPPEAFKGVLRTAHEPVPG